MKRGLLIGAAVLALIAGMALWLNYERWFVYPGMRAFVSNKFTDPESAQYRNEKLTSAGWLCGEVNWKNEAGGYSGFRKFASMSSSEAYLEQFGYVGDSATSADRVLKTLDKRISIVKSLNLATETTGQKRTLSDEEIERMLNEEIFIEKWKAHCAD